MEHYGWICPRCGKVYAPHIASCDCVNLRVMTDSCGTSGANPNKELYITSDTTSPKPLALPTSHEIIRTFLDDNSPKISRKKLDF